MAIRGIAPRRQPDDEPMGVRSPYALANLVLREPVDWRSVSKPQAVLEEVFGAPIQALMGYKRSPVRVRSESDLKRFFTLHKDYVPVRPALPDVEPLVPLAVGEAVRPDPRVEAAGEGWELPVRGDPEARVRVRREDLASRQMATAAVLRQLDDAEAVGAGGGFNAPLNWVGGGVPVVNDRRGSDPVQGAAANCYLIAAMSAVVATDAGAFGIQVLPAAPPPADGSPPPTMGVALAADVVPISDLLPRSLGAHHLVYAHSQDADEIWPGLVEKAYRMRTATLLDPPNMRFEPAGLLGALERLSGRACSIPWYREDGIDALRTVVQSIGQEGRSVLAATTATLSAPSNPSGDVNIVPSHAYTVLGYFAVDGLPEAVLIRNPFEGRDGSGMIGCDGLTAADVADSPWGAAWAADPQLLLVGLPTFQATFSRIAVAAP